MTFSQLKKLCLACQQCSLASTRKNVVFGDGNEHAAILFVGEAPGKTEDEIGVPFVGHAGKLLDSYLAAVGLSRSEVYIANIVKCRPPQNRDPSADEQDGCISWLNQQIHLLSPNLIVCLGRISAKRLIDADFKVTAQHGQIFDRGNYHIMGTFHPAALLRNPAHKPLALSDFKTIARMATQENASYHKKGGTQHAI